MTVMENVMSEWENRTKNDTAFHTRCLNDPENTAFEGVKIYTQNNEFYVYNHMYVYLPDYMDTPGGRLRLDDIMRSQGYGSFEAYVKNGLSDKEAGIIRRPDGTIDEINSPGWVVSMYDLAAEILDYLMDNDKTTIVLSRKDMTETIARVMDMTLEDAFAE